MVVTLFAIAWLLRRDNLNHVPETMALGTELAALAIGSATAWLGGELVDRLGIGVDEGAHPDSPSSLSGRPATEHDRPGVIHRDRAPVP